MVQLAHSKPFVLVKMQERQRFYSMPLHYWIAMSCCFSMQLTACGGTFVEGASCNEALSSITLLQPSPETSLTDALDESPEPGLQMTIIAATDLLPGSLLSLSQLLESGVSVVHEYPGIVDEAGLAEFSGVTMLDGDNRLRIHAEGQCNWFAFEQDVSVRSNNDCSLALPTITRNGVNYLSQNVDVDALEAGAQVEGKLQGLPGARVSLFHDEEGPLLMDTGIGESGAIVVNLNLQEGLHELQLECEFADEPQSLFSVQKLTVDTTAPECKFSNISEDIVISTSQDEDLEHDGTQVSLKFSLGESGLKPQDISLTVSHDGQELSILPLELVAPSEGQGQVTFWGPGTNVVTLRATDAAGNSCESAVSLQYLGL